MISKAACFPLSQLRTSIAHLPARYGLGQVQDGCPTLPSHQGGHDDRTQQTLYTDDCGE